MNIKKILVSIVLIAEGGSQLLFASATEITDKDIKAALETNFDINQVPVSQSAQATAKKIKQEVESVKIPSPAQPAKDSPAFTAYQEKKAALESALQKLDAAVKQANETLTTSDKE